MKTPADQFIINEATWVKNPQPEEASDLPYATHSGEMELFGIKVKCHRLSTGKAVIEEESMRELMETVGFNLP